MLCIYDNLTPHPPTLSQIHSSVATTPTRIRLFSWNQQFFIVPLHQSRPEEGDPRGSSPKWREPGVMKARRLILFRLEPTYD